MYEAIDSVTKCSIVFLSARDCATVNSCLRYLDTGKVPPDYELIFIKSSSNQIDFSTPSLTDPRIRFIEIAPALKLENLCLQIAEKASGRYIIFSNDRISYEIAASAVRNLEDTGDEFYAPADKNCIIAEKSAFIQAQSFRKLAQRKKERTESRPLDKLVKLLTDSSVAVHDIFFAADRNKTLFEDGLKKLNLDKTDKSDFYKILFLKSVKGYLDSGLRFENEGHCVSFYSSVRFQQVPPVPWYVGVILSVPHLNDNPDFFRLNLAQLRPLCAILVSVYNETRFTELCFKAIRKFTTFPYYLIAVNNSTIDMQRFKESMLRQNLIDRWFDSGCTAHDKGLQSALKITAQFRYIATLDCDAIVIKQNWLTEFIDRLARENAALIGPETFPASNNIKGFGIHPSCMVIDRLPIDDKFQITFNRSWPCDTGHLLTWDCLAHGIPIVKVSHEGDTDRAMNPSLINKSVQHYWCASTTDDFNDDDLLYRHKVAVIRQRLDQVYNSRELSVIRQYQHTPKKTHQ
jgi:hypothetical protein